MMKNLPLIFGTVIFAAAVALHYFGPRMGRGLAPVTATAEILLGILGLVLLLSSVFYRSRG
jgi:hypothetical protein